MPVKGTYLLITGGGAILVWSGLKGKKWSDVLRQLIAGQKPSAVLTSLQIAGTPANAVGTGTSTGQGVSAPVGGHQWSHAQLMTLWVSAGGLPSTANNAACHAIQESSGNAGVTSSNPDGGTNVGLWQLDTRGVGSGYTITQLQNPYTNARVAVRGSSRGTNWSEWATPGC